MGIDLRLQIRKIGHLAHLGGALAGALLTWWWLPAAPRTRRSADEAGRTAQTEELLSRVVEEGMDSLSREERRQLESLGQEQRRRW